MVLWNFVFHVVAEWLLDFQQLQRCPTEEERDSPLLKFHQRNSLLVVSQLLSAQDHQQDWVPSPLLSHHWQGIQANQGWPLSHVSHEVGFKNQTKPRLWGREERAWLLGQPAPLLQGLPSLPLLPSLLGVTSIPWEGPGFTFLVLFPSPPYPLGLSPLLVSSQ